MGGTTINVQAKANQATSSSLPTAFKRSIVTCARLVILLYAGILIVYFAIRWVGRDDLWFVDILGYILPWLFTPLVVLLPIALRGRSYVLLAIFIVLTTLFLFTYGHLYCPQSPVHAYEPPFTVMTYNVHIRNTDVDQITASIENHKPDIVGLHELRKDVAPALEDWSVGQYDYRLVEPGCCGILSRYPILDYQTFQLGEDWAQKAILNIEGRSVELYNVHLQMPLEKENSSLGLLSYRYSNHLRDANVGDLLSRLEETDIPVIVIGDFNMTDQQGPYAALTDRLYDAHRESGWGMGFANCLPFLGLSTWRIDYIFYSSELTALQTTVGSCDGSDHRPVIAKLAFRADQQPMQGSLAN
jgi:endonuclease/exonuclease/phosphatase (EEP) superfamily protein YafD